MGDINLGKNINFFAPKIRNIEKVSSRKKVSFFIPVLLVIALGLAYAYVHIQIRDAELESSKLADYLSSAEVLKFRKEYTEIKKVNDILKSYSNILDAIDNDLKKANIIGTSTIEKINASLPKDTTFITYFISDKNVSITGETSTWISSAELLHNINSSNIFNEVRIVSLTRAATGPAITFSMVGTLKEVIVK